MVDYKQQLEAANKVKKYSKRVTNKICAILWMEDNKFIHNMRRNIDKSERTLNITNKNIIKKLDVFCMQLGYIGFYINGNTSLYDDGDVLSSYLESFNNKQKSSYRGFEIRPYKDDSNFKSIEENFYYNKNSLTHAMEAYIITMKQLRRDHKNLKRFLRIFDTLNTSAISKMSKEELIIYFKKRKMEISPTG